MSLMYDDYLREHISNVQKALQWMSDKIFMPKISQTDWTMAIENAQDHDQSKQFREEYDAYDHYFYGKNRSAQVKEDFDYAWLHHQKLNKHHWQCWVLIKDDGLAKPLQMPIWYVLEMIADWWSFSWKKGNLTEIFKWYDKYGPGMILHEDTRKLVESILGQMKAILDMQKVREGVHEEKETESEEVVEHSEKDDNDKEYGVPELKKFPLPDADHVRSAIRFFNYVDLKYEQELADAINAKIEEYGITDLNIGDKNRFKKYVKEEFLAHHGILGQKWGVQNGPPYPLNRNALDSYDKEKITESSINKYKDQAKQLSHVRVNKETNGTIFTDNGKLIGMVNVEAKDDGNRWIQGLELFGDGKGKGLSYDLLDYATDELGATHLSVNKANTVAKHVYDKYGFKTYDETDDMYFMKINDDKD